MSRLNSIIICSRLNSRRVPEKALVEINGKPLLYHLLDRLLLSDIPIIVAAPDSELNKWLKVEEEYRRRVDFFFGSADDPMRRM